MKIKDAADLTGTTVRTIRWYHREGLVAVPEVRGGRRDYQLSHVARILRVRWLAQAGFTLNRVGELLERETHAAPAHHVAITDLHAALEQVDSSIEDLYAQRGRILQLIDSAESGRGLSSIPPQIDRIYTQFEQAVPDDPQIQRVLRRERHMAEMLCQRGLIRSEVIQALDLDQAHLEQCVDFLQRFAALKDVSGEQVGPAVVELSEAMLAWCAEHPQLMRLYLDLLPGWSIPGVRAVIMRLLMLEYRDPNQRALLHRTLDGLTDMIDGGAFAPDPSSSPQEPSTAGVSA